MRAPWEFPLQNTFVVALPGQYTLPPVRTTAASERSTAWLKWRQRLARLVIFAMFCALGLRCSMQLYLYSDSLRLLMEKRFREGSVESRALL